MGGLGQNSGESQLSLGWRRRQNQLRTQSAERRRPEGQTAAIQRRQLDHDRKTKARAGFCLVQSLPALRNLFTLRRRKAASIVINNETDGLTIANALFWITNHLNRNTRGCPFAGIVNEVPHHLLKIRALALKLDLLVGVDIDRKAFVAVNLLHGSRERGHYRRNLGD